MHRFATIHTPQTDRQTDYELTIQEIQREPKQFKQPHYVTQTLININNEVRVSCFVCLNDIEIPVWYYDGIRSAPWRSMGKIFLRKVAML